MGVHYSEEVSILKIVPGKQVVRSASAELIIGAREKPLNNEGSKQINY